MGAARQPISPHFPTLGATSGDLVRSALAFGLQPVAIGLSAAMAVARTTESMLVGVTGVDPLTYAGVGILMLVVSFVAGLLAALRILRIAPLAVLRET